MQKNFWVKGVKAEDNSAKACKVLHMMLFISTQYTHELLSHNTPNKLKINT